MPADILIDTNTIELDGGDVIVQQDLAVQGDLTILGEVEGDLAVNGETTLASKLTVEPSSGTDAIEIRNDGVLTLKIFSNGRLNVYHPNGNVYFEIKATGIRVLNANGATRFVLGSNGSATFYEDVNLVSGADIKLDGQFLANRLNAIEQRLTNGGL